jgi:hypothetical protein
VGLRELIFRISNEKKGINLMKAGTPVNARMQKSQVA